MRKKIEKISYYKESINYILEVQSKDGSISWEPRSKFDPWDHIECAMALVVAGEIHSAEKAFHWLKSNQEEVGGWFSEYKLGCPTKKRIETNFSAYVATGLWHFFLATGDKVFLEEFYPVLEKAINFITNMQTKDGDILWAINEKGNPLDDTLLTGCCSIYKSIECAESINKVLGRDFKELSQVKNLLKNAIKFKPQRFDRNWESKSRYSMDWYYPVLCGVMDSKESKKILMSKWNDFVVEGMGCKCVVEEPWVTVAESSELVIALLASGQRKRAEELFSWLHQWKDEEDNLYWTGYVYPDKAFWPVEKPTWTAAAILLAADSLYKFTDASELFLRNWSCIDE